MVIIEKFEDVLSWQKAREITKLIYELTAKDAFSRDFSLRDQIRRAAVSILSNIAEGFESQNDKTFTRFLYIAKASCGEVRSKAYVALDLGYITHEEFGVFKQQTMQTSKLIG